MANAVGDLLNLGKSIGMGKSPCAGLFLYQRKVFLKNFFAINVYNLILF